MTSRDDVASRFANDIAEHEMTVLHDEGLYRHVMFKIPRTTMYRFDLITWSGHLSIAGDMGSCTFRRLEDMFTFFNEPRVNLGYWAEKVIAGEVRAYSEDVFREWVAEEMKRGQESKPDLYWDLITRDVESDVLGEGGYQESAVNAVHYWNEVYGRETGFKFYTDEGLDFTDYTYRFMWQCHAIRWGVWKYYRARADGQ